MFNDETRAILVDIIAEGVAKGIENKIFVPPVTSDLDVDLEDELEEKPKKTRKKKATPAKKKAKVEKVEIEEVEADEDDDFDDLGDDDEGAEAEMIEVPAMDRTELMATLKRVASKHPNGEMKGRKLASEIMTSNFDAEKFGDLQEKDFEEMVKLFKEAVKAL